MQFEWAVFSLTRTQTTQHKLILPISSISQCAFVLSLKFSFFTYTHTIETQNKAKNNHQIHSKAKFHSKTIASSLL